MDFGDYVRLIRRSAWIIVALVLLGILAASGLTLVQKPEYGATATGYVSARATDVTQLGQVSTVTQQAAASLGNVARSAYVLDQVKQDLRLPESTQQLGGRVVASVTENTPSVSITVTGSSAKETARVANAVMARLNTALSTLIPGSNSRAVGLRLINVDPAIVPSSAASPKPVRNLLLGALAGLILGLLIAVVRQLLDNRISTSRDLERTTDAPVLGQFLRDETPPRAVHTEVAFAASSGAESFRTLRTNLRYLEGPTAVGSFVVTSPDAQENRAELAANLAIAMADLGSRVLVVDADLRRSQLARYLGVSDDIGLTDVLLRQVRLPEALQVWNGSNLAVLPAGSPTDNPNELLQSESMPALVGRLQLEFDTIIFNTPPLLAASDAAIVATYTSGALVVVEMGRTSRAQLLSALTALDRVGSSVLGLVATGLRESAPTRYTRRQRRPLPRAVLHAPVPQPVDFDVDENVR